MEVKCLAPMFIAALQADTSEALRKSYLQKAKWSCSLSPKENNWSLSFKLESPKGTYEFTQQRFIKGVKCAKTKIFALVESTLQGFRPSRATNASPAPPQHK